MSNSNLQGIVYNPTWPAWKPPYSNSGSQAQFSDADFANDSFPALWNTGTDGSGNTYRDDLATIANGGFKLIRLYNWGPTRGWYDMIGTAHINFLNYANSLGMQVIIPISNYFLSNDQYAWNNANPDGSFTFASAPGNIQTALQQFLSSVTVNGKLHPAVHSFSVGNEIDLNNMVGQGGGLVDPSSLLARVLWWIVNLQGQIVANSLGQTLLTSPISNADQGNPGTSPLSYWFQAFINGVTAGQTNLPQGTIGGPGTFATSVTGLSTFDWYTKWYYNSVNIYQTGTGLVATLGQYDQWASNPTNNLNWPGQQFNVPLLLTEIGYSRASNRSADQQTQFTTVMEGIVKPINDLKGNLIMGYCLYEFSDEVYLGSAQDGFGLFMVVPEIVLYNEATGTTQVSYAAWPSTNYPVDKLTPVTNTSGTTLISAING